jgi:hypothetical protein
LSLASITATILGIVSDIVLEQMHFCQTKGCNRTVKSQGFCQHHYMTPDQRLVHNVKHLDQYHRKSENSLQRKCKTDHEQYHSLGEEDTKTRNASRAKLARERYQRLRLDPESKAKKTKAVKHDLLREMEKDKFNIGDSVFISLDRSDTMDGVLVTNKFISGTVQLPPTIPSNLYSVQLEQTPTNSLGPMAIPQLHSPQ